MKLPESIAISLTELDRLFPLHILFSLEGKTALYCFGSSLQRVLGEVDPDVPFEALFDIVRPRGTEFDLEQLCCSSKTFFLKSRSSGLVLRGAFSQLNAEYVVFACSVEITSAATLDNYGLNITDFSPADPTPDIVILHRFRDTLLHDQQLKIEKLEKFVDECDRSDQYANTDELTGIGNRRMFWARGNQLLSELTDSAQVAIIIVDLDEFKTINDKFGHEVGDVVLQTVASRCTAMLKNQGIVARLGGDEFVALCRSGSVSIIKQMVRALMQQLCEPILCGESSVFVKASIGGAVLSRVDSIDDAIHFAGLAMKEGRKKDIGKICWFTSEILAQEKYRQSILSSIGNAIDQRELIPYFQPIVDIANNTLHGFEALARWFHPEHGQVYPDVFIELAIEAGCLKKLDSLILESALDQLADWDKAGKQYTLHVNLCGNSVAPGLNDRVVEMLSQRNIEPGRLTLELTETTLLVIDEESSEELNRLVDHGVVIQLDDFGTGYSSLTHLHEFPVTGIKIDRSFLFDFPDNQRRKSLIESVLDIASHLKMDVVTEGIETVEQLQWIESVGCRFGQGYLFGKPAAAPDCEASVFDWIAIKSKAA